MYSLFFITVSQIVLYLFLQSMAAKRSTIFFFSPEYKCSKKKSLGCKCSRVGEKLGRKH